MVSSRRRPGVFLLAIAMMMFSLVLLSATSSGAQTESKDQNNSAKAAVDDEECVEFENEGSNTGTTNQDTGTNTSEDTPTGTNDDATNDNASSNNTANDNSTGDNTNAADENSDTGGDTGTDTGTTNEDAGIDNQDTGTGTNGEDFTTSQDEGIGSEDGTTSQDDGTGSEECVVADTVPDESLLPTGAPANSSRTDEKAAKKKSDRGQEQGSRKGTTQEKTTDGEARKKPNNTGQQQKAANTEAQKKTGSGGMQKTSGGEAQRKTNRSETQSKSGSGGTTQGKSNGSETRQTSDLGETVRVRGRELEVDDRAGKAPRQEELKARAQSAAASDLAPRLAATEWTHPSREEVASTGKPRNFAPNPNAGMTLSARALGLYDMPVTSSDQREHLDNGLVHVPETSRPWDEGGQKNVFIAGHYLGAPQTPSRLAFYNLHKLKSGDELVLEDGRGQDYKYRVSEKFAVGPGDSWAMGEVRDRDMVTLQTCIPPDFGKRLMVRADRVRA
jgi:sortase A